MRRFSGLLAWLWLLPAIAYGAPVLRFGVDLNYPPFSWQDKKGQAQGFDIDIAYALCQTLEVRCLIVPQDWDGLIPALKAGKFDAILSSMQITPERMHQVDFSDKYYNIPSRLISRKHGQTEAGTWKAKRIGVLESSTQENFARKRWGTQQARIISYSEIGDAFLALQQGKLDAVFVDSAVGEQAFLRKPAGRDFAFTGHSFSDPAYFGPGAGIAVKKGNHALRLKLNQALQEIRQNGRYHKIQNKYFGFDIYGDKPQAKVIAPETTQ
ncbi:transporter substrate-binding domain-containing protein [Craterilacuibacter sp. RT1T]|uniref:transporter substrate-binding domain-containing protein n=1 Tax=Craterilacuibacter sp. RT1T TaxID=2942211 RepID=UPI0020C09357|nr:transporter substrate-binding domain-containing protein [Craterilacuibacter sp. RT1T]MCL6263926.1 transporter substrate-binding domain-containing protein [Craterilacuibacter sp. RT1T]